MAPFLELLVFFFCPFCLFRSTLQLQSSQMEVLQQVRKQLEYPNQLDSWNYATDLCNLPPSPFLTVSCEENFVTEMKIIGDKPPKIDDFSGYPIQGKTLSASFSVDSFFTTLSRLNNLKVLILVSLGIWGPLPDKIHRLNSLQLLDLTSNFLCGSIPPKISVMGMLHTLTLDSNFFNSTVPEWLYSLSNLTILSLKNNKLCGPLPRSISRVSALSTLSLSRNNISGRIPDLSRMRNLEVLDLRGNQLDSEIPPLPWGIITVLLSNNSITGEISHQIGDLKQLQHLDLSFNLLQGTPPPSIFALPSLSYLNLASNMLSGSLSRKISCGAQLGFIDISTNRLTGSLPKCLIEASNKNVLIFSGNCLSDDPGHQHASLFCEGVRERKSKWKYVGLLICIIGGASVLMLVFLLSVFYLCRRYLRGIRIKKETRLLENSSTGFSSELLTINSKSSLFRVLFSYFKRLLNEKKLIFISGYDSQVRKVGTLVMPMYRVFSLDELKRATDDFCSSSLIGEGCHGKVRPLKFLSQQLWSVTSRYLFLVLFYGKQVYRGRLENGLEVAVRCLALFKRYSIRNLNLRLDLLSKLRHPNLVYLMGHCVDSSIDDSSANRVFLIYEYMPNGSLCSHLTGT